MSDRFEWISVSPTEVSPDAVERAIDSVIATFVAASRRERARLLLDRFRTGSPRARPEKWIRWVQGVAASLDPKLLEPLEGNAGFPQHLDARFGDLHGIFVSAEAASGVRIAEAAVLGRDWSVFVSNAHDRCLVFGEVGPPLMCATPRRR